MPVLTANCPMCGCVHVVPTFDEKESDQVRCIACSAYFHYVARGKDGVFKTRLADRMTQQ